MLREGIVMISVESKPNVTEILQSLLPDDHHEVLRKGMRVRMTLMGIHCMFGGHLPKNHKRLYGVVTRKHKAAHKMVYVLCDHRKTTDCFSSCFWEPVTA